MSEREAHDHRLQTGGLHGYFSQAGYSWPDPAKPDGLPYVNRDGCMTWERNHIQ